MILMNEYHSSLSYQQQESITKPSAKVTTSLTIFKTPTEPVKTSTEPVKTSTEPVKVSTKPSQNRYVMQVLQNMPPPVTCDHDNTDKNGNSDEDVELEGLTPAQARVLQAQQRRLWRANKESELNDALNKAQAAIETVKEKQQSSNNTTTTITVTHQQQTDNNC